MPEPAEEMKRNCGKDTITLLRWDDEMEWPSEMYEWYAITKCYPGYSGLR